MYSHFSDRNGIRFFYLFNFFVRGQNICGTIAFWDPDGSGGTWDDLLQVVIKKFRIRAVYPDSYNEILKIIIL